MSFHLVFYEKTKGILSYKSSKNQNWEFAHSLIAHSLICTDRSRQMSDCEQIAQVANIKRATVSKSLRSLMTNEQQ